MYISFNELHKQNNKSTPEHHSIYKLSLLRHKTFNSSAYDTDWLEFANQIILTGRQTKFLMFKNNNFKIGLNTNTNKFYSLSNLIELDHLNLSFPAYKRQMKTLILKFNHIAR